LVLPLVYPLCEWYPSGDSGSTRGLTSTAVSYGCPIISTSYPNLNISCRSIGTSCPSMSTSCLHTEIQATKSLGIKIFFSINTLLCLRIWSVVIFFYFPGIIGIMQNEVFFIKHFPDDNSLRFLHYCLSNVARNL
jgi:hypothetical protein